MDREKYVDESWKESASQEKEKLNKVAKQGIQKGQSEPVPVGEKDSPSVTEPQTEAPSVQDENSTESDYQESEPGTEISFLNYMSSLSFQAMVFLGIVPNPMTNESEKNLSQAKLLIDTLVMLRDKTKGNLNEQENNFLNASIYELQMKYVEISEQELSLSEEGES